MQVYGAALLLGLIAVVTGCSDDEDAPTSTVSSSTTTVRSASTSSTVVPAPGEKDPDAEPVDQSSRDAWERSAVEYRGKIGEVVEFECPSGGSEHEIWGTNVYTDDSSVCTAAVHAGLLTFDGGGEVTINIERGLDDYLPTASNGVVSSAYGPWPGAFSFPASTGVSALGVIPWERKANFYANSEEEFITVMCGADGLEHAIWGTDVYADDSSICTAAVHAGLITFEDGGEVTFLFSPGRDSYGGSAANGVTSSQMGEWPSSFLFVL